jgi:DNA-binding NtrC family response regulator
VRELRNVVVQAAVMTDGEVIEAGDLPFLVQSAPPKPVTLEDMEREMILKVMTDTGGQQQQTAEILGISLRTLSRKLKAYHEGGTLEIPDSCN